LLKLQTEIAKIKAETDIPVGVGFGISTTSAKAMGGVADAVIVGSCFDGNLQT
jgi:tryptophan synthase alpha chain